MLGHGCSPWLGSVHIRRRQFRGRRVGVNKFSEIVGFEYKNCLHGFGELVIGCVKKRIQKLQMSFIDGHLLRSLEIILEHSIFDWCNF